MSAMEDFKKFVLRGNVVDLAVGVVIGAAFGAVVTALVKDIITPILVIPGKVDFSSLSFQIGGGVIRYGDSAICAVNGSKRRIVTVRVVTGFSPEAPFDPPARSLSATAVAFPSPLPTEPHTTSTSWILT